MRFLAVVALLLSASAGADFTVSQQNGFITLDNGHDIRVVVAPEQGGELSGLAVLFDGQWHELLYRAMDYSDRPGWRGKAPLLWPATGVSKTVEKGKQHYLLDGKDHSMPFHGFARDQAWIVVGRQVQDGFASIMLQMSGSKNTHAYYPFDFSLKVEYRIEAEKLSLEYTVNASLANQRPMPFSIGNHITFKAPMIPGSAAGEVQFSNGLTDLLIRDDDGAFSGKVLPSPFRGWHDLTELPVQKAVSLGGSPGPAELLLRDPSGLQLKLVHQASQEPTAPVIRFNLWADVETGFFSPEPWLGTQNSLNSGAGLVMLEPGQSWSWQIDIIPSRAEESGENESKESP